MVKELAKQAVMVSTGPLKKGTLVSHSRIYDPVRQEQKSSEVWTEICNGAKNRARQRSVRLKVLSPKNYHNLGEFLDLVEMAILKKPEFLILPGTPLPGSKEQERLLCALNDYAGKIAFVNVPMDKEALKQLGDKVVGYVGMNEYGAGQRAAKELIFSLQGRSIDGVVVLKHEEGHFGHWLRIQGIKQVVEHLGTPVKEVYVGTENQIPVSLNGGKFGVITLGNRGTEAALTLKPEQIAGLIGMDMNPKVADAILDSRVRSTIIQHPRAQGILAIDQVLEYTGKFQEYFCGPTVVTSDNVRVFRL